MYSTAERDQFTYTWFKNGRLVVIQDNDTQFMFETSEQECTSDLTLKAGGVATSTEVTCEVTTPSGTDSATSAVFPESKLSVDVMITL